MTLSRAGSLALVVLLAACGGAAGGIGVATGFNVVSYAEGDRRPAPAYAGGSLRPGAAIEQTEGKVVVLNFWGSWCGPCRREQPLLEAAWKRYRDRGVVFIGVNTRRDQRAAAIAFLDEFSVTYPSVYDPSSRIAFRYRIRFMPATVVVDRNGRIAARAIGAFRDEQSLASILDPEIG